MADEYLTKIMPHDLDLEKAIIGAMLLAQRYDLDIKPTDFYLESHREIVACLMEMVEKGLSPDLLSLKNALGDIDKLERVGGAGYLVKLTDGMPNIQMSGEYLRQLRDKAAQRRLIQAGNEAMQRGYAMDDPREMANAMIEACDEALGLTDQAQGLKPIADLVESSYKELEQVAEKKVPDAYAFGWLDIDRILAGGVRKRNLAIVAGRPGTGKTSYLANSCYAMAKAGARVGFFSLEMGAHELMLRMLASVGEVSLGRMNIGFLNKEDWVKIGQAAAEISGLPIFVDDSTNIGVSDMRSRIRRVPGGVQVCFVDYLQLLNPPEKMKRASEFEQVAATSKQLKFMAKSMDIGVVAAAQLSRASEKRKDKRPQLSDLRSSGQIEQDADIAMLLYREELVDKTETNQGQADVIIAKHRNGPTGSAKLTYQGEFTRFTDAAVSQDDQPDQWWQK